VVASNNFFIGKTIVDSLKNQFVPCGIGVGAVFEKRRIILFLERAPYINEIDVIFFTTFLNDGVIFID